MGHLDRTPFRYAETAYAQSADIVWNKRDMAAYQRPKYLRNSKSATTSSILGERHARSYNSYHVHSCGSCCGCGSHCQVLV
jgi:hypothetical protein